MPAGLVSDEDSFPGVYTAGFLSSHDPSSLYTHREKTLSPLLLIRTPVLRDEALLLLPHLTFINLSLFSNTVTLRTSLFLRRNLTSLCAPRLHWCSYIKYYSHTARIVLGSLKSISLTHSSVTLPCEISDPEGKPKDLSLDLRKSLQWWLLITRGHH